MFKQQKKKETENKVQQMVSLERIDSINGKHGAMVNNIIKRIKQRLKPREEKSFADSSIKFN
jgi:hypothetical protein